MHKNIKELFVETVTCRQKILFFSCVFEREKTTKREKRGEVQLKKKKVSSTFLYFLIVTSSWDLYGGNDSVEVKNLIQDCTQRVLMVILHMEWARCHKRNAACWELSHSLPVVLWRCDLVISGTEEGGWILNQVPEENVRLISYCGARQKRLLPRVEQNVQLIWFLYKVNIVKAVWLWRGFSLQALKAPHPVNWVPIGDLSCCTFN